MPIETHRQQRNPSKKPQKATNGLALLLADTDGAATAASGLGVLATDTQAPVVTETAVGADLLEALEVLTHLAVQAVGDNLRVLAVGDVALSVQEPRGDLVLGWGLEDGDDALELFGGELTSTVVRTFISTSDCFCEVVGMISAMCPVLPLAPFATKSFYSRASTSFLDMHPFPFLPLVFRPRL